MDKQLSPYEEKQYAYGRVWTALLLLMMLAVPRVLQCLAAADGSAEGSAGRSAHVLAGGHH